MGRSSLTLRHGFAARPFGLLTRWFATTRKWSAVKRIRPWLPRGLPIPSPTTPILSAIRTLGINSDAPW